MVSMSLMAHVAPLVSNIPPKASPWLHGGHIAITVKMPKTTAVKTGRKRCERSGMNVSYRNTSRKVVSRPISCGIIKNWE